MNDEFNDEHAGKGGSYVAGEDGKRELQERTDHAASAALHTEPAAPAKTIKQPKVKGASNA